MRKATLNPPPQDKWQATWSDRQAKLIHGIALANLQVGHPDMLSAWRAAETHFGDKRNILEARKHGVSQ